MKSQARISVFVSLLLLIPFSLHSQESKKSMKTVRIKTVEQTDGKVIVTDTTFTVPVNGDVSEIIKATNASGDSTIMVTVDVEKESDDPGRKIIIIDEDGEHVVRLSGKSGDSKVYVFENDVNMNREPHLITHSRVVKVTPDGEEEEIIVVKPHGHHKTIKWKGYDEKGGDFEFEFDTDALDEQLAMFREHLENIEDYIEEKYETMYNDSILRQKLDNLKNIDIDLDLPSVKFSPGTFSWNEKEAPDEVTDIELRDAGIKNKPDRLELQSLNVDNDDGIVRLSFTMEEEDSPKVILYNIYGDKIFSGTPEMKDGKYNLTIDLSKKQHGTYYLMIVSGNSSKMIRIRN